MQQKFGYLRGRRRPRPPTGDQGLSAGAAGDRRLTGQPFHPEMLRRCPCPRGSKGAGAWIWPAPIHGPRALQPWGIRPAPPRVRPPTPRVQPAPPRMHFLASASRLRSAVQADARPRPSTVLNLFLRCGTVLPGPGEPAPVLTPAARATACHGSANDHRHHVARRGLGRRRAFTRTADDRNAFAPGYRARGAPSRATKRTRARARYQ